MKYNWLTSWTPPLRQHHQWQPKLFFQQPLWHLEPILQVKISNQCEAYYFLYMVIELIEDLFLEL